MNAMYAGPVSWVSILIPWAEKRGARSQSATTKIPERAARLHARLVAMYDV